MKRWLKRNWRWFIFPYYVLKVLYLMGKDPKIRQWVGGLSPEEMEAKMPKTEKIQPGGSPDYFNERTGRCHRCKARFIWPTKLGRTKNTKCPFCGDQLQQTSYMWKGDTYRIIAGNK